MEFVPSHASDSDSSSSESSDISDSSCSDGSPDDEPLRSVAGSTELGDITITQRSDGVVRVSGTHAGSLTIRHRGGGPVRLEGDVLHIPASARGVSANGLNVRGRLVMES